LSSLIKEYLRNRNQIIKVENLLIEKQFECFQQYVFFEKTRAFIKIQDGCNFMCSYCIIPFSRGRQRSLDMQTILNTIKQLVIQNYHEIVLTGVNTAGYLDDNKNSFFDLLKAINKLDGHFRVRISSIEPFQISKSIIDLIINNQDRFCQHFHICLQSANDHTLKDMHRKYTMADFFNLVNYIRQKNIWCSITTDYIVGFNAETKEDFQISLDNLKKLSFADMHIFPFSIRSKTAAALAKNTINESIKRQRFNIVKNLQEEITDKYLKSFINQTVQVIFENSKIVNIQHGHSQYFFEVYVDTNQNLHNQ